MLKIVKAEPLAGYRLRLAYADGVTGEVDLSHLVGKGVFRLWTDPKVFEKALTVPEARSGGTTLLTCARTRYTWNSPGNSPTSCSVERLAAKDCFPPYAPSLEAAILPSQEDVTEGIRALARW